MNKKYKVFDVRCIGASHLKSGKPCQDYAASYSTDKYSMIVVCDGHGGDRYIRSDIGAKLAAEVCVDAVKSLFGGRSSRKNRPSVKFLQQGNDVSLLKQLASYIIFKWRDAIETDWRNRPFAEEETVSLSDKDRKRLSDENGWVSAYGTTLLAVVMTRDYWFGLHIGDGKCVSVSPSGEYSQPIPWDPKCFLNVTTSLCDEKALENFRFFFQKGELPKTVFIASDGVDDTFGSDQALHGFYKSVIELFEQKPFEEAKTELETYLPKLSAQGSQDDISIAGIMNYKF